MLERPRLGEIVVRAGIVDQMQLEAALGEQKKWGGRLGLALIKMGFLTESDLVRALASQLELPVASLEGKRIPESILDLVPYDYADDHTCLPLFVKEEAGRETLYLATDDPCNLDVLDDLAFRTGLRVKPVVVAASEICEGIDRFYRDHVPTEKENDEPETLEIDREDRELANSLTSQGTTTFDAASLSSEVTSPDPEPKSAEVLEVASTSKEEKADAPPNEPPSRIILHVLTQIMIEKGVMTRDEFYQRVQQLLAAEKL